MSVNSCTTVNRRYVVTMSQIVRGLMPSLGPVATSRFSDRQHQSGPVILSATCTFEQRCQLRVCACGLQARTQRANVLLGQPRNFAQALRVHATLDVLRPITTSSNANAAKAAEILTISIHYLSLSWVFGPWPRRGRRGWSLGYPWATDSRSAHGAWPSRSGSGASPASAHPITQIRAIERQRGLATSFRQQHNQRSLPRCSCSRQNPLHCQVPSS